MNTEFKLKNVALYTKGHYCKEGNVWDNIKLCLEADDYQPFENLDIINIIIRHVAPLIKREIADYTLDLLTNIQPELCWRVGYMTKDHKWAKDYTNEYDYHTAVLHYFLSKLQGMSIDELGWDRDVKHELNVKPLIKCTDSN